VMERASISEVGMLIAGDRLLGDGAQPA